jgi:hypothetical protein
VGDGCAAANGAAMRAMSASRRVERKGIIDAQGTTLDSNSYSAFATKTTVWPFGSLTPISRMP